MGASDAIQLNALQRWLILADILLPIIWEAGPTTEVSALPEASGGLLKRGDHTPLSVCEQIMGLSEDAWKLGWLFVQTNMAVRLGTLHTAALLTHIEVRELDTLLKTHYGHESSGQELHFRTLVTMPNDSFGGLLVQCGYLAGIRLPAPGPIADVEVIWQQSGDDIRKYGELQCGNPCSTKTDSIGIATLVFKPKSEKNPGKGTLQSAGGLSRVSPDISGSSEACWGAPSTPCQNPP